MPRWGAGVCRGVRVCATLRPRRPQSITTSAAHPSAAPAPLPGSSPSRTAERRMPETLCPAPPAPFRGRGEAGIRSLVSLEVSTSVVGLLALEIADDVLDHGGLAVLLRHDQPRDDVEQNRGAPAEEHEKREDQTDDVGVHAGELADPTAYTGEESLAPAAAKRLFLVHASSVPVRHVFSHRERPWLLPRSRP